MFQIAQSSCESCFEAHFHDLFEIALFLKGDLYRYLCPGI